jgi:hypothetical protein
MPVIDFEEHCDFVIYRPCIRTQCWGEWVSIIINKFIFYNATHARCLWFQLSHSQCIIISWVQQDVLAYTHAHTKKAHFHHKKLKGSRRKSRFGDHSTKSTMPKWEVLDLFSTKKSSWHFKEGPLSIGTLTLVYRECIFTSYVE